MDERPAALTRYDVVIVDPPWPIEKLDRDVRPKQVEVDYATMDADALRAFADAFPAIAGDARHLFMWTTQKFLPLALELVERAGFAYCLTMVWHKAGGFQPVGLPQYNCEFVVYAHKGAPVFIDTNFPCCFDGPRREHSRKPDRFYDIIETLYPWSRKLELFQRKPREGWTTQGDELPPLSVDCRSDEAPLEREFDEASHG